MKYTQITDEVREELDSICVPPVGNVVKYSKVRTDPSYFMFHQLGLRPYYFQHMMYREVKHGTKKIIVCSSRQIGKSIAVAVLALWAASYNCYPSGVGKNTKVGIVSASDEQAKKLMAEIKKLMLIGDVWLKKAWNVEKFFTSKISTEDTNTKKHISFIDGSFIKCFPPTDAARGETLDLLIIDEGAFVDKEVFKESIEPTTSSTGKRIIITSTPKGQSGFFYETFDPEDVQSSHEYKRFWFPYTSCEDTERVTDLNKQKALASINGNIRSFQQEYEAMFTVDNEAFFDSAKVDACINDNLTQEVEWKTTDCVLGIDYGLTICHSVLTISTCEKGVIRPLFQYAYPLSSDDNLIVKDIDDLALRFNIVKIIPDDCPQGNSINQHLVNRGYDVEPFNFRSDQASGERNRGYYQLRQALNSGRVIMPRIPELITELKQLQEIKLAINVKICKPTGGHDDRADSFLMSCIPFLRVEGNSFDSELVSAEPEDMMNSNVPFNPREDMIWMGYMKKIKE